ncbi:copper amine oxidase N-terminal domain-containing protein [Cohnella soli]|uniref:Copper amine oxidase N-terminal domain-containing protein n=1 Tax=Cohnella soli TaxID=425005 RepID=A0ABW0HSP1_9BACL
MRKWTLAMMACALMWAGTAQPLPQAAAAESISATIGNQETAVARAKQLKLIPENAEITEAKRIVHPNDYWRIYFMMPELDTEGHPTETGEVDLRSSDGELLSYRHTKWPVDLNGWGPAQEAFDLAKEEVGRKEATEIAKTFLENQPWQLNAEWMEDSYPESEYTTRTDSKGVHKIRFDRSIDGIRLSQPSFSAFVDRISGEVVSYEMSWAKTDFAHPKSMLTASAAARLLVDHAQPNLTNPFGDQRLLGYEMASFYSLDATKGTFPANLNIPIPTDKVIGKPTITKAYARMLLLSMYDIELQYVVTEVSTETWKAEPFYRMVVRPEVPRFYTGQAPIIDARTGEWKDYVGESLQQSVPGPSKQVIDAVVSTSKIGYPAAVAVEGKFSSLAVSPVVRNGKMLVPAKEIAGAVKGNLVWEAKGRKLTVTKEGKKLVMTVGSNKAYLNGKAIILQSAAQVVKGKTYIPAEAFRQAFGIEIGWQSASRFYTIGLGGKSPALTELAWGELRWNAQLAWLKSRG